MNSSGMFVGHQSATAAFLALGDVAVLARTLRFGELRQEGREP